MTFPIVGSFASKAGIIWSFRIWSDGSIDGMYRKVAKESAGGWKETEIRSRVTKECLNAVERAYGLKTDGREWIEWRA